MLLRSVMVTHGFKPVVEEWWHFTLANEPYPDIFSIFRLSDGREVDASELAAIRVGDCIFSGIGPVKLHAVVPRFLEAIARGEKNGD